MTLDDALDLFLTQLRADGRSEHTIQQYARHVHLFGAWLDQEGRGRDAAATTPEVVAAFLASSTARARADGRPRRATSANALRSSLRGFFSYLHRAGHLDQDPTRLVRLAICGTPPPRALGDDEVGRLLAVLAAVEEPEARRDHALFHLMLGAGLRVGSAVALDVEDVDLDARVVHVRRAKRDQPERVVLSAAVADHLRAFVGNRVTGPLFVGRGARRVTARHVQRRFVWWLGRAGVARGASTHSLRHTFATQLYRRTGDVLLVKEALRHRSVASTLVYARCGDEGRLRAAMEG